MLEWEGEGDELGSSDFHLFQGRLFRLQRLRWLSPRDTGREGKVGERQELREDLESWWTYSSLCHSCGPELIVHGNHRCQALRRQYANQMGPHRAVRVSV